MKNLENFDLDVINVLDDFPESDTDGFVYARANMTSGIGENKDPIFVHWSCNLNILTGIIDGFIRGDEVGKNAAFNAVLAYLNQSATSEDFDDFVNYIEKIKVDRKAREGNF